MTQSLYFLSKVKLSPLREYYGEFQRYSNVLSTFVCSLHVLCDIKSFETTCSLHTATLLTSRVLVAKLLTSDFKFPVPLRTNYNFRVYFQVFILYNIIQHLLICIAIHCIATVIFTANRTRAVALCV
jgi:hypothetical protein